MAEVLLTSAVIFAVLLVWQLVEWSYRRFAQRHPELGPFRPTDGCGGGCSCSQGACPAPPPRAQTTATQVRLGIRPMPPGRAGETDT